MAAKAGDERSIFASSGLPVPSLSPCLGIAAVEVRLQDSDVETKCCGCGVCEGLVLNARITASGGMYDDCPLGET